jgi:hypothetical protein
MVRRHYRLPIHLHCPSVRMMRNIGRIIAEDDWRHRALPPQRMNAWWRQEGWWRPYNSFKISFVLSAGRTRHERPFPSLQVVQKRHLRDSLLHPPHEHSYASTTKISPYNLLSIIRVVVSSNERHVHHKAGMTWIKFPTSFVPMVHPVAHKSLADQNQRGNNPERSTHKAPIVFGLSAPVVGPGTIQP